MTISTVMSSACRVDFIYLCIETSSLHHFWIFLVDLSKMIPYDNAIIDIFPDVRSTSSGMKSNVPKNARPNLATWPIVYGVSSNGHTPIAGWFKIENPMKMDDLGIPSPFQEMPHRPLTIA